MAATVPIDVGMRAFGVPATVAPPGENAVATKAIWIPADTVEIPLGAEFQRANTHRIMVFRRDEVPSAPRGTIIVAPGPYGGANKTWRVDGTVHIEEGDHCRVSVVLEP